MLIRSVVTAVNYPMNTRITINPRLCDSVQAVQVTQDVVRQSRQTKQRNDGPRATVLTVPCRKLSRVSDPQVGDLLRGGLVCLAMAASIR